MKVEELRIGNIVEQGVVESIGNGLMQVNDIIYGTEMIKPIPLTEEWLVKFGLNKPTNETPYHFKKSMVEFLFSEFQYEVKCYYGNVPMFSLPCKYLHQFQNLYFALIGEEL